jgi:hypothetical protein
MISKEAFEKQIQANTQNNIKQDIDFDTLFYLIKEVIFNNPIENCRIKGSLSDWDSLPDSKSLFKSKPDCGLPIGNLTSQLFSNVYLNDFDHYMKKDLNIKYYGRYVDDFYVFSNSNVELKRLKSHVKTFLKSNFALQIHPNKIYLQHYTKGFLFLGAYIKPDRMYIGNRTKNKFKEIVPTIFHFIHNSDIVMHNSAKKMVSVINSYLGLFSHYHTYKLRHNLFFATTPCILYRLGYFDLALNKITMYKDLEIINNNLILKQCIK